MDVIFAMSIGLFFIIIITESSFSAQNIFQKAKDREGFIESYKSHNPSNYFLYGNNFIEKNYKQASSSVGFVGIGFPENIYSEHDFDPILEPITGVPTIPISSSAICSVNFTKHNIVGSYEYNNSTTSFASSSIQIVPIYLPLDSTFPLTDIEVRNNIAYVSADSTKQSDPDILIFDISDTGNAHRLSSLSTGPGLTSIVLVGKRIYGASPSTINQLHIIRLDSLTNPILENYYKLALPYATATPAQGSAISYKDSKIFLGTEKWDGDEINIIDISNPVIPRKISGLDIGSKVNDILINKNTAYVSSANNSQFEIIGFQNYGEPVISQVFNPSGWQRQDGRLSHIFEQYLDFGRTSGGFDLPDDHEYFSWQNFSTTTIPSHHSMNMPGGVYGIIRDRSSIYLATRQLNEEFQLHTLDSSGFISSSTSPVSYSLPFAPQTMTCDGGFIYILANRAPFIYKISF